MPIIPTPDLPEDGSTADVGDYNPIIIAILALLNGQIDADNIAPASLPWSVMDNFSNKIPSGAMEDEGNLVKYRGELEIGRVTSGGIWSQSSALKGNMTAATVYTPNGNRYSIDAVVDRSFTASKDTYVSVLSNGSLSYLEVSNDATPPALTAGAVLLAVVVTNASNITKVHDARIKNEGEIARLKLGAASDKFTIASIPARRYMRIKIYIKTSGSTNIAIRFNNDSGNNYSSRSSTNGSSDVPAINSSSVLNLTPTTSDSMMILDVLNVATEEKMVMASAYRVGTAGPGVSPGRIEAAGKWANTTLPISRIDVVNTDTGDYAAGSEIVVEGWD